MSRIAQGREMKYKEHRRSLRDLNTLICKLSQLISEVLLNYRILLSKYVN